MSNSHDPLASLDFTPRCLWGEGSVGGCTRPARYGYTTECGCGALFCGEHDAQHRRAAQTTCPKHGVTGLVSRESLAAAS